jgi:hypothetical protein
LLVASLINRKSAGISLRSEPPARVLQVTLLPKVS